MLATTACASAALLTIGTTRPSAPASSVRCIQIVSFQGTRAIGTAPPSWMARKHWTMVSKPTGLCSASTTSQSQPASAILSAATGEQSVSQLPTDGCPPRSLSVTGLVVIVDRRKALISPLHEYGSSAAHGSARLSNDKLLWKQQPAR